MTDELRCVVRGCDFTVDADADWHEKLEQHVRWIHVREHDFGAEPFAALFALLLNGLIREDEFTRYAFDAIVPPTRARSVSSSWLWAALFSCLLAVWFNLNLAAVSLGWLKMGATGNATLRIAISALMCVAGVSILVIARAMSGLGRSSNVRSEPYPYTGEDDVDSGGKSE